MAKFTLLMQEDDYERQYQQSMDYLNSKYHDQPTKLKNIPSFKEWLEQNYGKDFDPNLYKNTPIGKLVI